MGLPRHRGTCGLLHERIAECRHNTYRSWFVSALGLAALLFALVVGSVTETTTESVGGYEVEVTTHPHAALAISMLALGSVAIVVGVIGDAHYRIRKSKLMRQLGGKEG